MSERDKKLILAIRENGYEVLQEARGRYFRVRLIPTHYYGGDTMPYRFQSVQADFTELAAA